MPDNLFLKFLDWHRVSLLRFLAGQFLNGRKATAFGVSETIRRIITEPMTPATAEKMNPHSQPIHPTTSPKTKTDRDLPKYGVALNML